MPFATISEREPAGGGLERVRLTIDASLAATHVRHGQYVEARHVGSTGSSDSSTTVAAAIRGFFALASTPGATTWDLLVSGTGSMAERLRTLPLGAHFTISEASGPGFPLDAAFGRPLLLVTTGSGIAAMRSIVAARISGGDAARTRLLHGARSRAALPLGGDFDRWRREGVEVGVCLSGEQVTEPGFHYGYVQNVLRTLPWDLEGCLVFAAGHDAMVRGLRIVLTHRGLPDDALRLNR